MSPALVFRGWLRSQTDVPQRVAVRLLGVQTSVSSWERQFQPEPEPELGSHCFDGSYAHSRTNPRASDGWVTWPPWCGAGSSRITPKLQGRGRRGGGGFTKEEPPVRSPWTELTSVRGLVPGVGLTGHSSGQQLASVGGARAAQQLAHHLERATLAIGSCKSLGGLPPPPCSPHGLQPSFPAPGLSMMLTDLRG